MPAPFSIYGSGVDQVAQQQNFYDSMYGNANQATRAAYDAAQARAFEAMLRQRSEDTQNRQYDDSIARRRQEINDSHDFAAQENELNRKSRLADVIANKAGNDSQQQEKILNEAANVAAWLPTDAEKLSRLYPMLSPDRIQRLSVIAGAAGQMQTAATAEKNAPQFAAAKEGADLADAGNFYSKIIADEAAIAKNPTNTGLNFGLVTGHASRGVPASSVVQPSDHARALMETLTAKLAPQLSDAGGKNSMIVVNPSGGYKPAYDYPPGTAPVAPAPAVIPALPAPVARNPVVTASPIVATPNITQVAPSVPIQQPPASVKTFTDKTGRRFVYVGNMADPSKDKNPNSWQIAK